MKASICKIVHFCDHTRYFPFRILCSGMHTFVGLSTFVCVFDEAAILYILNLSLLEDVLGRELLPLLLSLFGE